MGASGRGVRQKKQTVEDARDLSVFELHRQGVLSGATGRWIVSWTNQAGETVESVGLNIELTMDERLRCRISYTLTQARQPAVGVDYMVGFASTPCHFGGLRRWFVCPGGWCGRRVAKLYAHPDAKHYLCRHCHQLTYEGRQQHRKGMYESFGKFGLYRRRWEAARGRWQKLRWALRLLEAEERVQAYSRAYNARFWRRLQRLKSAG